ncbi:hypothetical protein DIPPA_31928 [Diplonema papillatum]|nr:hypothetical protein DIPPA_31928 [Diplonema papillatum]
MAHTGTVASWFSRRGYGFVECRDYDEDLFIHVSGFGGGELIEGRSITFDVEKDSKGGKLTCINVTGEAVDPRRNDNGGGGRRDSPRRERRRYDSRDRYDRRERRRDSRDRYDSRDRRRGDRYDSRDRRR